METGYIFMRNTMEPDKDGNLQPACYITENGETTKHQAVKIVYGD